MKTSIIPTFTSSCTLQGIRMLCVFALCSPVFAQKQSTAAIEIEACVHEAEFYIDTFIDAKDSFVAKRVQGFIDCLSKTSNPKDPEVQYALGVGYTFQPIPHKGGYMKDARAAFCSAAEAGYVLAQEKCAQFSSEDKSTRYKWALVAALNGSSSAQVDIWMNAWNNVVAKDDMDYNHYLVQYLGCHPAMFAQQDCPWASEATSNEECRQMRQTAAKQALANLEQCHKDLNKAFFESAGSSRLSVWERRANKQLKETLENIRQQVRCYPGLAKLQAIEP